MLTDPIQVGEKYKTRAGEIAEVTTLSTWEKQRNGSTGAAYCRFNGGLVVVFKDGPFTGRGGTSAEYRSDLVERIMRSPSLPLQLDMFD